MDGVKEGASIFSASAGIRIKLSCQLENGANEVKSYLPNSVKSENCASFQSIFRGPAPGYAVPPQLLPGLSIHRRFFNLLSPAVPVRDRGTLQKTSGSCISCEFWTKPANFVAQVSVGTADKELLKNGVWRPQTAGRKNGWAPL